MKTALNYLKNPKNHDWLITENSHKFQQIAEESYLQLTHLSLQKTPPKIILAEREPVHFLAKFIAACAANCPVFLGNPDWGTEEWQQVFDLVQPNIVWGIEKENNYSSAQSQIPNWIMIPTGGSSGKIKFTIHTWETLMASVKGFTEYFQLQQVNSVCVLPLYHVSGLMQFMRCFTTGGKLVITPFKSLESGKIYNINPSSNPSEFFISLVPTQLQRLLQNSEQIQWLSQLKAVLLGGSPAWDDLLAKSKFHNIPLAITYGMTETASQIATLKPEDFLKGKISSGQILPHAQVQIRNYDGEILPNQEIGNITIQAQSLTLGYYPQIWENQEYFSVDDLGFFDNEGYLNIVGRNSDKIISGGENIYPIEIEAAIRATHLVVDVSVIGIPDQHWGQALTAMYIPKNENTSSLTIQTLLQGKLSKFKIPKYWIPLPNLPRNYQGKINRQQLQEIATKLIT